MLQVAIFAGSQSRREWLRQALEEKKTIRVEAAAGTFAMLRSWLDANSPDGVIVDLQSASDLNVARAWILELFDHGPVIVLSSLSDTALFRRLLRADGGAMIRSDSSAEQMIHAIESACSGLITIDSSCVPGREQDEPFAEPLTPREIEVLRFLADGSSNREIANQLDISEHTIKFHIRSILAKLGASTRAQAVTRGFRAGLIDW